MNEKMWQDAKQLIGDLSRLEIFPQSDRYLLSELHGAIGRLRRETESPTDDDLKAIETKLAQAGSNWLYNIHEARADLTALLAEVRRLRVDAIEAATALRRIDVFEHRNDALASLGAIVLARDIAIRILGIDTWKSMSR